MSNKIEVNNPLGVSVVCSRKQWYKHVITEHPVMRGNEKAVEETIETPDSIHTSTIDNRHVYFKNGATSTYNSSLVTKVVTETDEENNETVVTAFPTKKAAGGIKDEIYHK